MNTTNIRNQSACLAIFLTALLAGLAPASAAPVSFSAQMSGGSDIIEVLDPNVPLVRVQTTATGSGVMGLIAYRSGDVVNLASGVGSGENVFENAQGDELYADFTVQLVPSSDGASFTLIGSMQFDGGTGLFAGASGTGSFLGTGRFTSASHADTSFAFEGQLNLVPVPATAWLAAWGLLAAVGPRVAYLSRRRGVASFPVGQPAA